MSVVQKRRARRGVDHLQYQGEGEDAGAGPSHSPRSLQHDASVATDSGPSSYPVAILDDECVAKLTM